MHAPNVTPVAQPLIAKDRNGIDGAWLLCAICAAIVGMGALTVMIGWLIQSEALVRIVPFFVPMQFNTALGLLLCSIAVGGQGRWRYVDLVIGLVVFLFAGLTLVEYAFHKNLGIDTIFVMPFDVTNADSPGRMASNTTIGMIFTGAALVISSLSNNIRRGRMLLVTALGSVVVAVGAIPLIGSLAGVEVTNIIWGTAGFTAMHTAISFILLGFCIIIRICRTNSNIVFWLPVPVCLAFVIIAFSLSTAVRIQENAKFDAALQVEAENVAHNAQLKLTDLYQALDRMAGRWDAAGGTPQNQWEADATGYLKGYPFLTALSRTDPDTRIEWLMPLNLNSKAIGFRLDTDPDRGEAVRQAIATKSPQTTHVLKLLTGDAGFLYVDPLFSGDRFDGLQNAAFKVKNMFDILLDKRELEQVYLTIEENGAPFYSTMPDGQSISSQWHASATINNMNYLWTVRVSPTPKFLESKNSLVSVAVLLVGLLTAFLMTLCTYLVLRAHTQNQMLRSFTWAIEDSLNEIYIVDTETLRFLKVNKGGRLNLGYNEDELEQMTSLDIKPEHTRESIARLFAPLHEKTRDKIVSHTTHRRKNGTFYNVETHTQLANYKGRQVYFQIALDETDRMHADNLRHKLIAELAEAEELKQKIFQSSGYMIIASDVTGTVHTFNRAAENCLGYSADEIVGKKTPEIWHDEQEVQRRAAELSERLNYTINAGYEVFTTIPLLKGQEEREWTYIRKDGKRFPVDLTVTVLRDKNNVVTGYLGIAKDITQEKYDAEQRRIAEEKLSLSEERLHLAASGTSDGLWDWNVVTNDLYYSPRFLSELGYADGELAAHLDSFSQILHPDDNEATFAAVAADHLHQAPYNTEYRLRHKDGHYIWFNARGQTVWDDKDNPIRMTGFITNIDKRKKALEAMQQAHDELKKAEEQRQQLIEKLTESNTELGRFAYVASHDMQEPLRMIANFGALIAADYGEKLDEEGREYIQIVTQSALRMQAMVNDLLEYARVGNDTTRFIDVNLTEELGHVEANLASAIKENNAEITHSNLPNILGNPVQLMRLLQNLVGNGLKYQPKGRTPTVHVSAVDRGDKWEFAVRDNGIGMEPQYVNQIFEPFKRLHSWQEYKGTGIGLAVCKKIVENHGGTIWVTSEPDKGSIFYFTVPKTHKREA